MYAIARELIKDKSSILEGRPVRLLGVYASKLRHIDELTKDAPQVVQLTLF